MADKRNLLFGNQMMRTSYFYNILAVKSVKLKINLPVYYNEYI